MKQDSGRGTERWREGSEETSEGYEKLSGKH